jgi:preprotein translocase subunit SecG
MVAIVIGLHVVTCLALIVVILLQQGKGAEIGAVFGGSSQTVFGATGAGNVLTKTTWTMAAIFFATSIFLAYASTRRFTGSIFGSGAGFNPKVVYPSKPVVPPAPGVPAAPANPAAPVSHAPAAPASAPLHAAPAAPAAPVAPAKPVAPRHGP